VALHCAAVFAPVVAFRNCKPFRKALSTRSNLVQGAPGRDHLLPARCQNPGHRQQARGQIQFRASDQRRHISRAPGRPAQPRHRRRRRGAAASDQASIRRVSNAGTSESNRLVVSIAGELLVRRLLYRFGKRSVVREKKRLGFVRFLLPTWLICIRFREQGRS